jgi:hypothetical protein
MRLLLFCIASLAAAQSKPNFDGTWILNLGASDYNSAGPNRPDKIKMTIHQKGDHFLYRFDREKDGKKSGYDVDVTVGSSPYESDAAGIISMEWKGDVLVVSTLYNPGQDRQSDQVSTWTLSADGKRLTDDLTAHPPKQQPAIHIVRVFDKQ